MRRGLTLAVLLALGAGACGPKQYVDPLKPPEAAATKAPETAGDAGTGGETGKAAGGAASGLTPHIYMALQPGDAGAVSVVFAIDARRDNTPGDDPAIRLTPEGGQCNPQELRRYAFPPENAGKPVFGPAEVAAGISARDLPSFMAMSVTAEMLRRGLVKDAEESKPQNVCTRKLWERMIVNESQRRAS